MKGKLLVFEGADNSGKSSAISYLSNLLGSTGRGVTVVQLPGKTRDTIGGLVDALYHGEIRVHHDRIRYIKQPTNMAMQTLMTATILEALERDIKPALDAGHIVLCDRFVFSTIAYSIAAEIPYQVWDGLLQLVISAMRQLEIQIDGVFHILRNNYDSTQVDSVERWLDMHSNYNHAFNYVAKHASNVFTLDTPVMTIFNTSDDITDFWMTMKSAVYKTLDWHEVAPPEEHIRTKILELTDDYSPGVQTYKGH